MGNFKLTIVLFFVCFLIRLVNFKLNYLSKKDKKKKSEQLKMCVEIGYLKGRFKLDTSKLLNLRIGSIISLVDAFIICLGYQLVTEITNKAWLQIAISAILIPVFIIIIYEILGNFLLKRGYGRNE